MVFIAGFVCLIGYGMDYVQLTSDVFSLSEGSRIIGSGYASCNFGGYLYLPHRLRPCSGFPLRPVEIQRAGPVLTELNKGVDSISRALKENDLVALRRRLVRLQGQIATNIEHDDDLQKFQTSFDSVHHDFFKRLEEEHPDLSHKEKLLCAYIQMNLLTKEIAPLLNISVRGVEIGRYRLRKKLKLEERASLTEHLRQLTR